EKVVVIKGKQRASTSPSSPP
ncbi:hypothetical protein NPIL_417931, partial [Nephila pilipes]